MKFLPFSAKLKYRYQSFSDVNDDQEVVKDVVDDKCTMSHGANDSTEDALIWKKANVSITYSSYYSSCSYSSIWLEKSDASRRMESYADWQSLSACNKHLMKLARFLTIWIPWVYLIRYPGKCFPGDRLEQINLLF